MVPLSHVFLVATWWQWDSGGRVEGSNFAEVSQAFKGRAFLVFMASE